MKKTLLLLIISTVVFGCEERTMQTRTETKTYTKERVREVDYRASTVPEEGGVQFTQYTDEQETVLGPYIKAERGIINWYAPSIICISPDGGKLCYLGRKDGKDNIYIKNTSGGRTTVQRTFRGKVLDMDFSPDGKSIAFTDESEPNNYNIYLINATEGSAIQQITSTSGLEFSPSFSKDSKMIYFTRSEFSSYYNKTVYSIWSFNRETSLLTQYSEGFTPHMAPNNSIIVCTRNNKETGNGELWTINVEKGQETLILSDPDKGYSSPNLSPDGKKIVCVGTTLGNKTRVENLDIFTINLDGTGLTQLTFHQGHDVSPKWAPDSKSIYILSQRGNAKGDWNVWSLKVK